MVVIVHDIVNVLDCTLYSDHSGELYVRCMLALKKSKKDE